MQAGRRKEAVALGSFDEESCFLGTIIDNFVDNPCCPFCKKTGRRAHASSTSFVARLRETFVRGQPGINRKHKRAVSILITFIWERVRDFKRMMWCQSVDPKPTVLKCQRNKLRQMDMEIESPPAKKRKTSEVSRTQTNSPLRQGPKIHYSQVENSTNCPLEDGLSIMPTIYNATNTAASQLQQHQSTGQQSSERDFPAHPQDGHVGYQDMNSLLGSLHLSRRRQKAGEAGFHQNCAQRAEPSLQHHVQSKGLQKPEWQPPRPKSSQKRLYYDSQIW